MADRTLLLIDKAPKRANDRTWCFWEAGEGVYEPIVHRQWSQVAFHGHRFSRKLPTCFAGFNAGGFSGFYPSGNV